MSIFGVVLRIFTEWRAKKLSLAELTRRLDDSTEKVARRFEGASNTRLNLKQARHVIGIERWAQRRLRVALGEPPVTDEYDSYRPDELSDLRALHEAFVQTRQETKTIIQQLQSAGVSFDTRVPHNELGPLSIRGWLLYLIDHAGRETLIMR